MPAVATYGRTGDAYIDGVLGSAKWAVGRLSFSFPSSGSYFVSPYGSAENTSNFGTLNAVQQSVARGALNAFAAVANLSFAEIGETATQHADLRFALSDVPGTAWAYFPTTTSEGGDVWFNRSGGRYTSPAKGNYAYLTFLHETGHALGLEHAHEGFAMPQDRDSMEYTVMSYRSYAGASITSGYANEAFGYAQSLMMYDIAAVQHMYGANYATNSGSTTYSWSPTTGEMFVNGVGQGAAGANRIFQTIWDGGGTDTYDFSNYTGGVRVNLEPGGWTTASSSQLAKLRWDGSKMATGNIANALLYHGDARSLIENVVGGSGNDVLTGNASENRLAGGAGNDVMDGGPGRDGIVLTGQRSQYSVVVLADGSVNITDTRPGSPDGADTARNIEWFAFADKVYALAELTTAITLGSQPLPDPGYPLPPATSFTVSGSAAADRLYGTSGNDSMHGGLGDDWLDGLGGTDTAIFGMSREAFTLATSNGHTVVQGTDGRDSLVSIERLQFTDGILALEADLNAGQMYRLYQAAFARVPDEQGLGYWIREYDAGRGDLTWVAANFIGSAEFARTYGSPGAVSNEAFLNLLYKNVLGRAPDAQGKAYWMDELAHGFSRAHLLASFSESYENKTLVSAAIHDGIWFT